MLWSKAMSSFQKLSFGLAAIVVTVPFYRNVQRWFRGVLCLCSKCTKWPIKGIIPLISRIDLRSAQSWVCASCRPGLAHCAGLWLASRRTGENSSIRQQISDKNLWRNCKQIWTDVNNTGGYHLHVRLIHSVFFPRLQVASLKKYHRQCETWMREWRPLRLYQVPVSV